MQRAAAIDAGIDPTRRGDLDENIRGGVTYLKQKLDQSGGNVEQALSRYNRGTPTYRGIGDPHYVANVLRHSPGETAPPRLPRATTRGRSLLARVGGMLSPRSAEAAEAPTTDVEELRRIIRGEPGSPLPRAQAGTGSPTPHAPPAAEQTAEIPRAPRPDISIPHPRWSR